MTQTLTTVRFLDGGYCTQFARLAGEPSWQRIRFHAVFVYIEHPVHGGSLIDTGYSARFESATRTWPERLYRWATPVVANDPVEQLRATGIDPSSIRRIFLSHFHGDHAAGLQCFPHVEIIYPQEAYERLVQQSTFTQVRHGVLMKLLPDDFRERGVPVSAANYSSGDGDLSEFMVCDYWNDGSLLLVDLPGHADGHYGFVLATENERLVYVVDACWHLDVMLAGRALPAISRGFQADWPAYQATQQKLRSLTRRGWTLVACHCPHTLRRVHHAAD